MTTRSYDSFVPLGRLTSDAAASAILVCAATDPSWTPPKPSCCVCRTEVAHHCRPKRTP
jgi:hypothetical protein